MILIGQYDSPFTRRVGIALTLYGLPFEHRPWSVFGDADLIRPFNPLTRVPTLVLDNGESLIDSHMILDHLDRLAGPERALFPNADPDRYRALRITALAAGISDKAVSLFYELRLHERASDVFADRCRRQISEGLMALERDFQPRRAADGLPGHAEIAIACTWRHLNEAHPGLADISALPRLAALADVLEATEVFQRVSQPFIAPA